MATPGSSSSPSGSDQNDMIKLQDDYLKLRRNVALGMLVVAPALIALPPRKLDLFTFGLGFTWVVCLNEVLKPRGTDLAHVLAGREKKPAGSEETGIKKDWKGHDVYQQFRQKEEDGKGIGEMIMESVWEVWQQKDKRQLTPEQEEEEDRPLKERFKEKYEADLRKQKEREATDASK